MTEDKLAIARLRADFEAHLILCDARWAVAWKLAAALGGLIGLIVSVAVGVWLR